MRTEQIRREAATLRARYAAATGAPYDIVPLDDLAERLFLLTVFEDPTLDPRINGELNAAIGSIRLRHGMASSRCRFVVAHELGHYVLEGGASAVFEDDDTTLDERASDDDRTENGVLRAYNTRERHEQEANRFALELLIPADTLWQIVTQRDWTVESLARHFAVSADAIVTQLIHVCCLEPPPVRPPPVRPPPARALATDPEQQAAVDAPLPTLVVAGPGTGKTRSIVAKYLSLVAQGVDPAAILALTFSNKAAEEMRERIVGAFSHEQHALAARVEVSTFHAWGLNFLTSYGHLLGLPLDMRLRPTGDIFILLKQHLADLPLDQFKSLHNPGQFLVDCMRAISRAKDELWAPARFRTLAEIEGQRLVEEAERKHAGKTTKTAQKARDDAARKAARLDELAAIYTAYEALLRDAGTLDYGDLIMRAVEALQLPEVAAELHARYAYILVDEFQDINYASGTLVALLDGGRGRVWAVGDVWQSIYRFRGASSANLRDFTRVYPTATTRSLARNYRSTQPILDASYAIMAADPGSATRPPQHAQRPTSPRRQAVVEWVAPDEQAEVSAIAHDILRRVGGRLPRCVPARQPIQRRTRSREHRSWRWQFGDHVVLCRKHAHAARVVAALEAHNIPVDWIGDLYSYAEVKDALAVCALVSVEDDASALRAFTLPEHALDESDLALLIHAAHASEHALPRVARDAAVVATLSRAGQTALASLHATLDALAEAGDAWQVVTRYLFSISATMRERLRRAGSGDHTARRELATLGQLANTARAFVRQAPTDARDARAFIAYVRLLIESGETPRAQTVAGVSNVVRVLTVHASKGLEFPIVYLPCLQEGQFPARPAPTVIPPVRDPGIEQDDDESEERYLLYVAMTRARDKLILSRAATRNGKTMPRSSLLPGSADGSDAPWPLVTLPPAHACPQAGQPFRLTAAPIVRDPLPASSIDTYEACPRRYFYQYGYQLYNNASPYLRMHQIMREVVATLVENARDHTLPADEDALRALVWQLFATHALTDTPYAHDYFAEAFAHARSVWNDLHSGRVAPESASQTALLRRPAGKVIMRIDRVDQTADGPRWIHTRSGRERADDHLSTRVMLYALAYEARYERDPQLAIYYTATDTERAITLRSDVLDNHTMRIDALLEALATAHWEPDPGAQCATCPFNLICPV